MDIEPGFTRVTHPGLGQSAVVPESSLPHWHRCGWQQLAAAASAPQEEPVQVTEADEAAEDTEE